MTCAGIPPCRGAARLGQCRLSARPSAARGSRRPGSRLGEFPFTTSVTLTLDGRTYRATAVYPDDEIEGNEPSVALEFVPDLPGL